MTSFHEINSSADELLRALTAHTPVGVFVSGADGACTFVNERWCELAGLSFEEALGDGWTRALHPDDRERVGHEWAIAAAGKRDSVIEYRFLRPDGSVSWIRGYATAYRRDGGFAGWIGSCLDLTAEKVSRQALERERKTLGAAFDEAPTGMALVSPDGRFLRVNRALCTFLGYPAPALLGRTFQELTFPADLDSDLEQVERLLAGEIEAYRMEKRYVRADGARVWAGLSVSLVRDEQGAPVYFVSHVENIHDRKLTEQRLRREADNDPLTGLYNRRRFLDELESCLKRLSLDGGEANLILLDVDRFKRVNDTHGHGVGDRALTAVADALRHRLRATDVIARLGGDEFAVLAVGPTSAASRRRLADDILESIRRCDVNDDDGRVRLTASAGLVPLGQGDDVATALEAADEALYAAKRAGRDQVAQTSRFPEGDVA